MHTWILILILGSAPDWELPYPTNEQPWKFESQAECTVKLEVDAAEHLAARPKEIFFMGCVPYTEYQNRVHPHKQAAA